MKEMQPIELTGQAQNTYSRGMSENQESGGSIPENINTVSSASPEEQVRIDLLQNALRRDPSLPVDVRGMMESLLRDLGGEVPVQGETAAGIGSAAQLNPQPEILEDRVPEARPDRSTPEEQEARRALRSERASTSSRIPSETETELSDRDIEMRNRAERRLAKETPPEIVLDWIVNPVARDEYFNEIYAIVDSRPYDFWQTAFDQIQDGAKEHYFNETLNKAFQDRWEQIESGPRIGGTAGISKEDVRKAIAKRKNVNPDEVQDAEIDGLRAEIKADFYRFQREREVRRTLHDVNAVIYIPGIKAEELFNQMQRFDSASGDIALSMTGVREMMNIYENVLREIMAENNGWLPSDQVLGKDDTTIAVGEDGVERKLPRFSTSEAERRTKERFRKLADAGLLVTRAKSLDSTVSKDKQKWETKIHGQDRLKDWDLDRIFTISRGMMIMEERLISLAAESKLPANDIRYASGFLQDVVQSTSIYAHMITKWGITQEAMAAYLYEGKNEELSRFFGNWDPKRLKEAFEEYQRHPEELFESLDHMFYLGRRNPNRAGDIYTWISWRATEKPDVPSMMQDFLLSGRRKMTDRLSDPEIRKKLEANKGKIEKAWKHSNHGKNLPENLEEMLIDEYQNWSGTGFRFEKLRGRLAKFNSHNAKDHHDFEDAFGKAQQLLGRMVDLQPHRIYMVSRWVRERVGEGMTDVQKATLSRDLENLSLVESAFLNARERLLDEGKTFDTITIEDMNQFYDATITDLKDDSGNVVVTKEEQINSAKALASKIREDFANEGRKSDKDNNYWKEFVYKREYTHGYVLWSGDTPADEYNFSALGATGGFVRRARDNNNQIQAATAEVELIDSLKFISSPEQLYEAMEKIFTNIDHYDRSKAQQAIAEKLVGILRVYKANSFTKVPVAGFAYKALRGKNLSYARMMYGPDALALESSDLYKIIMHFEHKKRITPDQAHEIMKLVGATKKHLAYEFGVTGGQLLVLAFILQLLSASGHALSEGLKEA